ncbi:MAG: PQQ-binding-like beta-propeller repeat protein [Planctomycetaceae bacterium]
MRWRISVFSLSLIVACLLVRWSPPWLGAQEPPKAPDKPNPPPANPLQNLFQKLMPAPAVPPVKPGVKPPVAAPPVAAPPVAAPPVANSLQDLFRQLMPPAPRAVPPLVPNPLQNLFQKMMPPPAVPPPAVPPPAVPRVAGPTAPAVDPDARDHIDARAAKDRKQAELFRKANVAVEGRDWTSALDLLQTLLAQEEDSVERIGKEWHSVRDRSMRLMLKLPIEVVRSFRQRIGAEAARRLDEAEQSGRIDRLAQVAARYLVLEQGQTAAQRLAMRHLDRGEFVQATRWFRWLDDVKAAVTQERSWQLQAALAAKQAGDKHLAEKWLTKNRSESGAGQPSRSAQDADDELLEIGSTRIRVSDWWGAISPRAVSQIAAAEWPMFFGAPNRAALSRGGEPLLLPRWRQPLTQVQPLQQQLEMLIEDMHDLNRPTISVCQPLLVNGLVVMRTLGGVQVLDVETGRPLWSTAERFKAEDLVGPGQAVPQQQYLPFNRGVRIVNGMRVDYSNMPWEQHPLAQLLFANGNFGVLSTDGRQLFSVEDDTFVMQQNYAYYGNQDLSRQDPLRRSWNSNKLVSYDLRSGRPLWAVGGVESDEPFQPELPGVFFFGAPVPDGHELFVIGERDAEIRLFCLQADSGKLLWTQLLATAEAPISRDAARRQFAAQVSIAEGVVICPTTVGWLAAVDRASRQLLWVHRYSTPQPANNQRRGFGQPVTPMMPWGMRWSPSAPVIVGDAVVYTPQEVFDEQNVSTSHVVCVGLHDGTRRWQTPKQNQNWMALNGVADGKVLLLGQHNIGALHVSNGQSAWTVPIPIGEGVPSGLGTIANDHWHVPLTSGQIWTMSLKSGSRTGRQWTTPGTRLGNLSLYRGGLVSAHPAGLACFEQRESIAEQIRLRKERDPDDVQALLTEAAILQLERKSAEAWTVLRRVDAESVSAELRSRYLSTLREVLTDVIQQNPAGQAEELALFEKWLTTPDDQLQAKRLRIEHLRGRGEHLAAFEKLCEIAAGSNSTQSRDDAISAASESPHALASMSTKASGDAVLKLSGSPPLSIRSEAWAAGQLADLWNSLPVDGRGEIDRRIHDEVQKLSNESPAARQRGLELFAFHPATREPRWQEIETAIAQHDVSRAEFALLRLSEGSDPNEAARAWQRLVELYRKLDLPNDAAVAGQRLARLGDVPLSELTTGDQTKGEETTAKRWVENEINAGRLTKSIASNGADWSKLDFKLERSIGYSGNMEQVQECSLTDARWPFFAAQRFQYQILNGSFPTQRLAMSRVSSSQPDWSLPLRFKSSSVQGQSTMIRTVGHQMLVYHREVLHLLSPVDQRVLWTRSTETRGVNNFDPAHFLRRQLPPMRSGAEFVAQPIDPIDDQARNSLVTLCTPEFIAYRGRRVLTMLDAPTGQWRWELRDLPNDTRIQATNELMFLTSPSRWPDGLLLRTRDGRSLPFEANVREQFQMAKTALGNDLLVVLRGQGDVLAVERWNPQTRQAVWRETFPNSSQFGWLDNHTLASLGTDGKLATLDLDTRESKTLATLKPADVAGLNRPKFLVSDNDRVFLILSGQQTNYYGDELATIPVNGILFAFDRRAGGELWRQKVENQGLVLNHFGASPVVLFSARSSQQRGLIYVQLHRMVMFDKQTGRKLFDDEFTNQYGGFRLNLNLAERYVELRTYNDRLRLVGNEPLK